jgi:predicted nucleotidyltransferase
MSDKWLERFKREAVPRISKEFKPQKIIIFGSRVRGTAREDSDIDVILVSDYFASIAFLKRMSAVLKKVPFPKHVDYICYTPAEYERIKNESSVIMDANENSIEVSA